MLALRTYRSGDAKYIASWLKNETEFMWWSAGNMGKYPLDPDALNAYYAPKTASGEWFPKTLEEDGKVCGQLLMRWKDKSEGWLHFGLIVVDPTIRGRGLGSAMLTMALEYAFHMKGATRVTLNVFADNASAIRCYERLGFVRAGEFTMEIAGQAERLFRYEKRPLNA